MSLLKNRILNLAPDATLFGSIGIAFILDWVTPTTEVVPFPFNLVGWLLIVTGIISAMRTLSFIRLRRASSDVTGMSATLVTDGFFSVSRNPLYVAYVLTTIGAAIAIGSLVAFVGPTICLIVLHFIIIPFEEKRLQAAFGQKYEQYRCLVRRWV